MKNSLIGSDSASLCMSTKERIVDEALSLFSVKGYSGTSVKNIADAVGIKDSSLYKHFKSKKEICDTIVLVVRERIENMSERFGLPNDNNIEAAARMFAGIDEKVLVDFSRKIFGFYLNDSYISRFWRMGSIERYNNSEIYELYQRLFLDESIEYQTMLFGEMSRQGILVEADPEVMAFYFYTPIYFLLSKYSNRQDEAEEALDLLDKQVREFYRLYRVKES